MLLELEENNFIKQDDGNILFKASEINTNYKDLLIVFTKQNTDKTKPVFGNFKGGYSFGTFKQYKVIVINNLREDKTPNKGILKDSFVHEFIHYLDYKRSKGYSPKFTNKTTEIEYYNSPTEYNAYYQEAASYISNLLKDKNLSNKFIEKFKTYEKFYNWMLENAFDKHYISNLNDLNIKKIKKRVYNIWNQFFIEHKEVINENGLSYEQVYYLDYDVDENTGMINKNKLVKYFTKDQATRNISKYIEAKTNINSPLLYRHKNIYPI